MDQWILYLFSTIELIMQLVQCDMVDIILFIIKINNSLFCIHPILMIILFVSGLTTSSIMSTTANPSV